MKLWIAAAEASGDVLAAELVAELRERIPSLEARGLAGPRMRAVGVTPVADAERGTALGIVEVVRKLPAISELLRDLGSAAQDFRPDVAVTVDSPGLMLRHARTLRDRGIPVAHWVAPQVWAWRPGRAARIGRAVDTLMCLLPFEPPWFHAHGVRAVFTGHPAAARYAPTRAEGAVVLLAPGSRPQEVARHAPVLADVARRLRVARPDVTFRVPVAPSIAPDAIAGLPGIRCPDVGVAARGAAAAVVASGTVTLELAAMGVPMVALYQVHPVTWAIGRTLVRGVRHLALPSVLAGRAVIPEHLQHLDPEAITRDVLALLADGSAQRADLRDVTALLAGPGAVGRAADEVVALSERAARSARRGRSRSG